MAINNDVDIPLVLNYLNKKPEQLNLSKSVPPHTILSWTGGDSQPTDEQINQGWTDYKAAQAAIAYKETRKGQYPEIGDQLDDLYKQGAFSADMSAKIKKVKDDNPKP
jgi:hypothetical protein